VGKWINDGLKMYSDNPKEGWRAKDSAIFLFAAIATKGTTTAHGVTSTNALVNVVDFFSQHVFQDLQAAPGSVHPILQVDAIRFLYVFRNQLTKEQLISVLPLLVRHLNSDTYVTYTYAATTIERILFIKQNNQLLFAQADIHDFAPSLVDALLTKIEAPGTAEKIAENEHLMKCAMRVIFTARQTLTPVHEQVLTRLVGILGIISKNPSNPNFDQYIFESISGLMRFIVAGSPATLPAFEHQLFGPFTYIIQQDIDQYIPYVYQVLAQMLSLHATDVPAAYRTLVPFLLTPAVWQQKGSIPGLVKLLKAFLEKDHQEMIAQDQVKTVLAVVQQRLIPSKLNDAWGFDLVQAVVQFVPPAHLKQYFKPVIMSLLTRLQTSKTDKYVYHFSYFLLFAMAVNPDVLSPDFVISTVEEVQPGLWAQVLNTFVLPQLGKMPVKDRKVAVVGMSRMLTQSDYMLQEPAHAWPVAFTALIKLFQEAQYLTKSEGSDDPHAGITEIDYEEQTAGYQAAYSRLAASEETTKDPVGYVNDPRQFLSQQLVVLSGKAPGMKDKLRTMIQSADPNIVRPFVEAAVNSGFAFV
jgi:exportin-2 (importin alpha re-exporter)